MPKHRRHTDTDFMRICAAFFVILIHASGSGSLSAIILNSISRFSVPVFILLSGYYMLANKPDIKQLAKKSCKLYGLMLIWSGIYFIYDLLRQAHSWTSLSHLVRYLLTEPVHLWYIYAAIALYIITPILYVFHSHASREEYLYALTLTFFFGTWIVILVRADISTTLSIILDQMKFPYTLGFVFLYLLGGYFRKYEIESLSQRLWLYITGLASIVITIIGTLYLPNFGLPKDLLLSFFAPNVIIPAAAFFVLVQQFFRTHEIRMNALKRAIHCAAECSMGIYFIHPLILSIVRPLMEWFRFPSIPCVFIILLTLITWILSITVVFIGKRIPGVKWLM